MADFCKKCGKVVSDETSFCPECGTPISREPDSQSRKCPNTYLALSILTTIFCCLPFGIVGIVNSVYVSKAFSERNYAAAEEFSRKAKKWSIVALCCGAASVVIYLIIIAIYGVGMAALLDVM